jgi:hypothetical protein
MVRFAASFAFLALGSLIVACGRSPNTSLPILPTYDYSTMKVCFAPESVSTSIELADVPGKAAVYAAGKLQFNANQAFQIATLLGIRSVPEHVQKGAVDRYQVKDDGGAIILIIDASRGYIHYRESGSLPQTDSTPPVPDDSAINAALKFLEELNLSPKFPVDNTVSQTPNSIEVRFAPRDLVPSLDTTETIKVVLRKNGEVWQLDYYYQEPELVGDYPLISQLDALERLRECRGDIVPASSEINVTDVELVYLGVPLDGPYEYFIPAYDFSEDLPNGANQGGIIPAITDEYLTVNPPSPCCSTPTPMP